mmetsp:Transcript_10712/g.17892  ORF Transcript_10712/g.17892 Transcript_10712/m.17892 type:complete len:415 (-) Transcript_10712:146-1390(-)|eukprot:CAMPEP_0168600758 /NCGR_PEP_ID=MMETSP0420-20121227/12996_1 /TAXON_ID=498008 /ORGANISM="Pessonella sp." /LENGTH=414 /DNA_ID=CAMNT_0008638953 /DNA_START=35 /DNA_END=1279 /DNA_ORIENTATION=+
MFTTALKWIGAGTRVSRVPTYADYADEAYEKIKPKRNNGEDLDDDDFDYDDDDNIPSIPLGEDVTNATENDPYIEQPDPDDDEQDEEYINPTDLLCVSANTDNENHTLIVTLFDEYATPADVNSYNHHDYILAYLPLCLEWFDFNPGRDGNFVAIGSRNYMGIDVWDLDVANAIEPLFTLGGEQEPGAESVIGLAWNGNTRHLMASGSTEHSIRLWDLNRPAEAVHCNANAHKAGVQALQWNPNESVQLLSAGFDKKALLHDARSAAKPIFKTSLEAEPECVAWLPNDSNVFVVSQEKATVQFFDVRNNGKALLSMKAADSEKNAVTGLAVTSVDDKTIMATCSTDGSFSLWDVASVLNSGEQQQSSGASLRNLVKKNVGMPLFCVDFCRDNAAMLACGGQHGFAGRNVAEYFP